MLVGFVGIVIVKSAAVAIDVVANKEKVSVQIAKIDFSLFIVFIFSVVD
jgi:hypothetical protein